MPIRPQQDQRLTNRQPNIQQHSDQSASNYYQTNGGFNSSADQLKFKLALGIVNDGAVPNNNENPSTPLIVKLRVNNTFINITVDTGSAKTIINIKTLQNLKYRPSIRYKKNTHQTANNSELHTIGLVRLKIKLKGISTFVLAKVAIDLCTALVL
ncbi:unnamed protein product [Rotaria sp. Silwood2]|nr:unnamed protein product [Rotaria sp. Silwood2]CAF4137451.1 unnamed protein product [Rotaria sp. Silwood2]